MKGTKNSVSELIGKTLGHYRILEVIGQGGMATVYKAVDLRDEKVIAIKVMLPILSRDEGLKKRFRQEAKMLSRLKHPNIVPILEYGEENGHLYYILPYMSTGSLTDRLANGPVPIDESAQIISQAAAALQHAHDKGVVHRDVKPSNILLDKQGKAQLSDFGFAYWTEATLSLTGSGLIGTPGYMSPEQCLGEGVTELSDQYSLGVVLYRLIVGRVPFEGETPLAIALKHINEPLPPPREVNHGVPVPLEDVLITVLDKNPKNRYGSISIFNDTLQDAILISLQNGYELTAVMPRLNRFYVIRDRLRRRIRAAFSRSTARRWPVLLGVIAVLLAFPLGAFALRGVIGTPPNDADELQAAIAFEVTIAALNTANAPLGNNPGNPGQIQTAVAGTLSALETQTASEQTSTPIPASWSLLDIFRGETHTATPTPIIWYFATSTPTATPEQGSGGEPTGTPTPTHTSTPGEPTTTLVPTNTLPPATPTPETPYPTIDPSKCKDPGHPIFGCTPTPGD
ncbi:MAG: serine/threonine protein kinase [Anaerolineales bacterium]|nr:serine/threonine protein kinase [Anaerolineales bacterium]